MEVLEAMTLQHCWSAERIPQGRDTQYDGSTSRPVSFGNPPVYAHVLPDMQRAAASALGALLHG